MTTEAELRETQRGRNVLDLFDILAEADGGMTPDEARLALQRVQRRRISTGLFSGILADIRNPARYAEYGYTITPCKKGPNGGRNKIFVTFRRADGQIEVTDEMRAHFSGGTQSSVATITKMADVLTLQVQSQSEQEQSRAERAFWTEFAVELAHVTRWAKRALASVREQQEAA